jgi:hypothetical protein
MTTDKSIQSNFLPEIDKKKDKKIQNEYSTCVDNNLNGCNKFRIQQQIHASHMDEENKNREYTIHRVFKTNCQQSGTGNDRSQV